MPIYQYNGQHYDIATDDPDEAKRKIVASLTPAYTPPQTPVSAMPAPVEGSGGAAFGVYRPAGRRPESQQDREAAKEMPLQTARGVVTGTLGAIPDLLNLPGTVYGAVTGEKPGYRVPGGSEDWNQMLPGQSNTPQARLARFAGEALAPVPTVKGVQAIGQGAQMAAKGVQNTVGAGRDMVKGAFNAATGGETALAPLGKTYVTPEGARLFREGRIDIPTLESSQYTRPVGELPTGAIDRAALKVAGNQIPLAGKGAQAFGERVMTDYIANPYKAAVDIGLPLLTGGAVPPIYALGRGIQAAADVRLAGKGFDPSLQQQVGAAKAQQAFQPPQPQAPRLPYNPTPAAGPVAPETMYATPGGQVGTNLPQVGQAALNERYPPYTPPPAPTPAQQAQAAAAARITQSPSQALGATAKGQEIAAVLEQRRQAELAKKQQRWAAAGVKLPEDTPTAPVAGPVTPTEVPTAPTAPVSSLDRLRGQLNPMTPEEQAAVDTYLAKSPRDKAAQTRAENAAKKAPPGVSNMIVPDENGIYPSKEAFDKGTLFDRLSSKTPAGGYREGNTVVKHNADGSIIKTSQHAPGVEMQEKIIPGEYGDSRQIVFKNKKVGSYAEDHRGPNLIERTVKLPGMRITETLGEELYRNKPRKTSQIEVVSPADKVDYYENGKYIESRDDTRMKRIPGPVNGPMPDIESLIKQIKGDKAPPGTVSMIADEGAEVWRILKTKTQTLGDGSVVKTYPYDEAGKVKVRETQAPGAYGRTERTYHNTETGAMIGEQTAGKNDLLDRWIELPDGTEINQRFASEMRNGQPVRTEGTEVIKNKQKDVYIDGKYSHSYNGRNSLIKGPVNGKLPDIESLIKQIKGD